MSKRLVVSAMANRIYYADILKDGAMGTRRVDLTDDVIRAVAMHLEAIYRTKGKAGYKIEGIGQIEFIPYMEKREE